MKLDVAVNEITLSNTGAQGEFRIRNSAKAFKILSDGLYSNKIRAVIRELSCNALDSHVGAGKPDAPFEVHLPTMLEPWFSVRDFGMGLDATQVTEVYTTYFESTKTESNDYVGALGLGSKSPFSYTENFTVTAIKNGIERIYSAFINEMGVPSIVEMSSEITDQGNGVEVKFSVTDRYDYNSFRHEAEQVFMWFKIQPNITGAQFNIQMPEYKDKDIVPGVHASAHRHGSIAVMGNIAYPLSKMSEPQKHFGELARLLDCGLVMEFEIGELDFAASREELSYVPLTIASIKRKLEALNANLATFIAEKANKIDNLWERAVYLYGQRQVGLYSAAVEKYAADTKFPLFDSKAYHGKKDFVFELPKLEKRELGIQAFRTSYNGCVKTGHGNTYINNNYIPTVTIPVDMDVVIVFNDLKTGCVSRARHHFTHHYGGKRAVVYCVSHSSKDLDERQKEYDKIVAELHNPPIVFKASDLVKPVRQKSAAATQGIAVMTLKSERQPGYEDSYTWAPHYDELDEDEIYYYVCLSGYQSIDQEGNNFPAAELKAKMDTCGLSDISDIQVFGVRKNRIKEIKELDNWVWLEDKLKEETAKVSESHIKSLLVSGLLDQYPNKVYTSSKVGKMVGPDSYYSKFIKDYIDIKRITGHVNELVELCTRYGKTVKVEDIRQEITDAKTGLYAKYPLLEHLTHVEERKVADYIKLIDKQEKN